MTSLIEAVDLGKSYGGVIALREVSTVVNAGEVTCVLGDNGAGKSTLIKILAGVHQHDRGELRVGAKRSGSPRPGRHWISASPRCIRISRWCR